MHSFHFIPSLKNGCLITLSIAFYKTVTTLSMHNIVVWKIWYIVCLFGGSALKNPLQFRRHGRRRFDPCIGKIPWSRKWHPTLVFLPGKSHGHRSLAGYSPWGHKESDMTERLSIAQHRVTFLQREILSKPVNEALYSNSKSHFVPEKMCSLEHM